jgi:hypothetical protein
LLYTRLDEEKYVPLQFRTDSVAVSTAF